MKNTAVLILALSFLFQSCSSYKTIDLSKTALIDGKTYKIKIDNKFQKASLVNSNDSVANFKVGKKDMQISKKEISEIQIKKFSTIKTVSLCLLVTLGVVGIATIVTLDKTNDFNPKGASIYGS